MIMLKMPEFEIGGSITIQKTVTEDDIASNYGNSELDRLFVKRGPEARVQSHAFFSAMNGILISFRNYPGRSRKDVTQHMLRLGSIVAGRFKD